MCPKNFKSFHTFFTEKRRVECKKMSREKEAWLIASKFQDPCSKSMGRRNIKSPECFMI